MTFSFQPNGPFQLFPFKAQKEAGALGCCFLALYLMTPWSLDDFDYSLKKSVKLGAGLPNV